jgi:SAM-dependent methyltransferase
MRGGKKILDAARFLGSRRYRLERRLVGEVIAQIPAAELRALQMRHEGAGSHKKYLRIEERMQRAARQAIRLGLAESQPMRILDLGCGTGYFLAVARQLGHEVMGLDLADSAVFNDVMTLLKIPRIEHAITPFTPMPEFGVKFDLITAHLVRFNWTDRGQGWTYDVWRYFLDDCRSRLAAGGRVRLALNPGKNPAYTYLPDDIAQSLREYPNAMLAEDKGILTVSN